MGIIRRRRRGEAVVGCWLLVASRLNRTRVVALGFPGTSVRGYLKPPLRDWTSGFGG